MSSISLSFFKKLNHTDLLVEITRPKYRYYKTDLDNITKRCLRSINLFLMCSWMWSPILASHSCMLFVITFLTFISYFLCWSINFGILLLTGRQLAFWCWHVYRQSLWSREQPSFRKKPLAQHQARTLTLWLEPSFTAHPLSFNHTENGAPIIYKISVEYICAMYLFKSK